MIRRSLNGETGCMDYSHPLSESIAYGREAGETETSKYPEEEKETSIP